MTMPRPDQQQDLQDPRTEAAQTRSADPREPQDITHKTDTHQAGTQQVGTHQPSTPQADRASADRDSADRDSADRDGTLRPDADTSATRGTAEAGDGDGDRMKPEGEKLERLVPSDRASEYGSRWDSVKGSFVDEPRDAVSKADALVGELLGDMEKLFREQRAAIESKLDSGESSTEDMRLALRRYRSLFDRLLSV